MQNLPDTPYHAAIAALALEIGLDPQGLAECEELIIDGIPVAFRASRHAGVQGMEMACKVGPLTQQPLPVLRLLLQANTLGFITGGATLGLQHGADDVVLASAHPLGTPPAALARACRMLTDIAGTWSAVLQQNFAQADPAPGDTAFFRG